MEIINEKYNPIFMGDTSLELKNHLLNRLPEEECGPFLAELELNEVRTHQVLYEKNAPVEYVYFPQDCVASVLTVMQDGTTIEAYTIGREGMVGLPVFLGDGYSMELAVCQVPGQITCLKAESFKRLLGQSPTLQKLLGRYIQALFTLVAQSSACNRLHSLEQRCARWLLMTYDRVEEDRFSLTQDYLASMLGVRRAGVTVAAGVLQKAGLIRYSRGVITILDRSGLEKVACECYRVIADEFDRLLGPV